MSDSITNADRAARAESALQAYAQLDTVDDDEMDRVDLLRWLSTDIRHLCTVHEIDLYKIERGAYRHYLEELNEEA